jgi:hypothetical protein
VSFFCFVIAGVTRNDRGKKDVLVSSNGLSSHESQGSAKVRIAEMASCSNTPGCPAAGALAARFKPAARLYEMSYAKARRLLAASRRQIV